MDTDATRILIIDDSEIARDMISDLVAEAGYEVTARPSPIGAAAEIMRDGISPVIVDKNMPVMDGDGFIELVRQHPV